jgi:hypothetical protein
MADDLKSRGALSLQMVPILESGSNWSDFERRMEEWLVMSGLGYTLDVPERPVKPLPPSQPGAPAPHTPGSSQTTISDEKIDAQHVESAHQQASTDTVYIAQHAVYEPRWSIWKEKQRRGCKPVQNRCGYNQYKKIQSLTTVYEMMAALQAGKSTGSGKLIDLTSRFYAVNLSDCKNVTELSSTLAEINNELKDLHVYCCLHSGTTRPPLSPSAWLSL